MSLAQALALLEAEVGGAFPAAALAHGDQGRERLRAGVGAADLGTWFDLASLTKALCTSVLAMRLCAAGRLGLDEEVLGRGPMEAAGGGTGPPAGSSGGPELPGVTVAQLLGHAAGLPAWQPLYEQAAGLAGAAARQAVVAAAGRAPREPAGARAVYSDLGFILLGDLIEQRGGARLDELFAPVAAAVGAEVGFRPLGEPRAVPDAACAPTRREPRRPGDPAARELLQGVVHDDNARAMGGVAGHAGLFGTVGGVAKLAAALCAAWHGEEQGLGVPQAIVRAFFAARPTPGATWALGWDRPDPGPSSAGARWPRDGVGHLGFTGCSLWLDPPRRRWAVLLSNRVGADDPEAARQRLQDLRPRVHDALCPC